MLRDHKKLRRAPQLRAVRPHAARSTRTSCATWSSRCSPSTTRGPRPGGAGARLATAARIERPAARRGQGRVDDPEDVRMTRAARRRPRWPAVDLVRGPHGHGRVPCRARRAHRRRRRRVPGLHHPRMRDRLPGQPVRARRPTAASSSTTRSASSAAPATWSATPKAPSRGAIPKAATVSCSDDHDGRDRVIGACLKWVDLRPDVDPLTGAVHTDARTVRARPTPTRLRSSGPCGSARRWHARSSRSPPAPPAAEPMLRDALAAGAARARPRRSRHRCAERTRRARPGRRAHRRSRRRVWRVEHSIGAAARCPPSSPPSLGAAQALGW